jgi:hypothetical protein
MKKLWLAAAMAVSVAALQLPASAAVVVNGIPPGPHGIHGIIYHPCHRGYRCCHRWPRRRCGPLGIIGHPIGIRPIGRPIGVRPIGVTPVRPGGGLPNGITPDQRVQH